MKKITKRALSSVISVLFCVLLCFSSFAATTNEYGLGLSSEQKKDTYTVKLYNQNNFPVSGVELKCELPEELRTSGKTVVNADTFLSGQSLTLKMPLAKASGFIGQNGAGIRVKTAAFGGGAVVLFVCALFLLTYLVRRKKTTKAVAAVLAVFMLLPCFNLMQVNAWGVGEARSFTMQDTVTLDGKEYPITVSVRYVALTSNDSYFETTVNAPAEDGSVLTEYITSVSGKTVAAQTVEKVTYEVSSEIDNYTPEGFGEAVLDGCNWSVDRFDLKPGDNKITVTSTLSDGRTQSETYHLTYDKGTLYQCEPNELVQDGENSFVNGMVNIFFRDGVSVERADEIIRSVGGVRIGELYASDLFQARVDAHSAEELQEYCNRFEQFEEVRLAMVERSIDLETQAVTPTDKWMMSNPTWNENYPKDYNWSVVAVRAPSAWEYNSYMSHVNLGMVDSCIYTAHEDFKSDFIRFADSDYEDYAADNINFKDGQHGTHVAGTMGATANNAKGITGLLWNTNIYAANFNLHGTVDYVVGGVVDEILAGAKAVNLSLGLYNNYTKGSSTNPYLNPYSSATLDWYAEYCVAALSPVINDGKEFVVVQSAGNGVQDIRLGYTDVSSASQDSAWFRSVDAYQNGLFCSIQKKAYNNGGSDSGVTLAESTAVYDRVLVVGAAQNLSSEDGPRFKMWHRSNGGSRVDVYAPGVTTVSTCVSSSGTSSTYAGMSGTSQAAPIVTAVAGACFAINPNLTGVQVKKIICNSANSTYVVEDNTDLFTGTPASSDAELAYHPFTGDGHLVDMELCVKEALRTVSTRANYSELNTYVGVANGLVSTDYTNFDTVQSILDSINYNLYSFEQNEVDAKAQALATAIYQLNPIYADYTKVDEAIEAAGALTPGDYVDFSAVTAAVNAVKRNKLKSQQAQVDAMEKAINDAIAALVVYVPEQPKPETLDSNIVVDTNEQMVVLTAENMETLITALTATQGYTVTQQENENGNCSTGSSIVLQKDGCEDIVYQVAVLGAIDGDAKIDGFDAYLAGLYAAEVLPTPQGVWFTAGDADSDGTITAQDSELLARCALSEDMLVNGYIPAE
ncbi:MAG TPA: hypothetical protein DDY98_03425 [Ruminococcaceae bacterium]|nr:hypothetical protein [Oscillospiraceae bacterium]